MVVLFGFFLLGEEDFTFGFFFFGGGAGLALSLKAAVESSALTDSAGGASPPAMLVSIVLVSAPLSISPPPSPFFGFFFETRIRFGLGGFT